MSWWTRWQPSLIHVALRAGADVTNIAAATGLERRWRGWPDVQGRLDVGGRPAVDVTEVECIQRRLATGVDR